jgi:hypothetical protein
MSVAALSTAGFTQYIAATSNVSASQQAFQSLQQSLASGNLAAAQSAFNTYNQLNQSRTTDGSSGSTTSESSTSQLSIDLVALGSAISSGNLSNAQSAFATLQSDMKSAPSQALTNAEGAVAQTVQWVDDLLGLSGSSSSSQAPVDPTTAILNSAYGQNASSSSDPTTSILDSAYGTGDAGNSSATSSTASSPATGGNTGSGASVNVYA